MGVDGGHLSAFIAVGTAAALAVLLAFAACGRPHGGSGGQPDGLVNPPTADSALNDSMGSLESAPPSAMTQLQELPRPQGVDRALWSELKDALKDALKEALVKTASTPPAGDTNRVSDLSIADNGDGTFTLAWHYRNLGDYGQDGKVGISDITPIAQHFGEEVPADDTARNSLQAVIDGSGNGRIGIEDVTPIAQYYNMEVDHYLIEGAEAQTGPWAPVSEVAQSAGAGEGRLEYSEIVQSPAALWHRVVPYDAEGNPGEPSNAVLRPSNEPVIYEVTPTEGYQHEECDFTAAVSGAEPLAYAWNFGGGATPNTSSEPSPTVTLSDAGEYEASLTVTNAYGSTDFPFTLTVNERDMWTHTWGGSASDSSEDVAVDSEGNVYVLGCTQSFGAGDEDILLLKYAPDGELQWARTWGGEISDNPAGIAFLSDSSIVVGGNTPNFGAGNDDIFILKYDPDGNLLMQKTWGTADYERAEDMVVDEEGNLYFIGFWLQYGGVADMMICKFSPEGDALWAKTWGGAGDDRAKCAAMDAGGSLYVAGTPNCISADYDLALIKYSASGDLLWAKSWGGSGKEGPTGMAIDASNSILIAGATDSFGAGDMDVVLLEWNSSGSIIHAVTWGTSAWDGAATPAPSQSGNIYVACDTKGFEYSRQSLLLEYNSASELITSMIVEASASFKALCEDAGSNLYIVGRIANTNWIWGDAIGVSTAINTEVTACSGAESVLEGTTLTVDGIIGSPTGIEDAGGGGADALVVKNIPR